MAYPGFFFALESLEVDKINKAKESLRAKEAAVSLTNISNLATGDHLF